MANTAKKDITSRVIDINGFRSVVRSMDDTSDWLSSVGESTRIFNDMMTDGRIGSLVEDRKAKVLLLNGSMSDVKNKKVAEACHKYLNFNLLFSLNNTLLNAVPFGISIVEVCWDFRDGYYVPASFVPVPRQAVSFPTYGADYGVPVLTSANLALSDPNKFLVHRRDSGDGNVWGSPVLRMAYWPWKFKKMGFRFWLTAAEKIGVPSILAIFETKNDAEAQKRADMLTAMLQEMESGSSGAFGNVKEIQVVQSAINDFDTLVKTCNSEIAYAISAQNLSTNETQYGTQANAAVHEKTFSDIIKADAYQLQRTVQKLFDAFVRINFPGEDVPQYDIDSTDYASWEQVRDAIDRGVPVSLSALYEKYHLPKAVGKEDEFVKPQQGLMFSDAQKDAAFFFQTQDRK